MPGTQRTITTRAARKRPSLCALGDLQYLISFYVVQELNGSTRPSQLDFLDERIGTESEVYPLVGGTGVAARRGDMVVLHQAGLAGHLDPCSDAIAVAFHSDGLDGDPVVGARGNVVQQFGWTSDSGDDDINLAVVVEVPESAPSVSRGIRQPRWSTQFCERSILQIPEYRVRLTIVLLRIQVGVLTHVRIGTEQIFVAVIIEIVGTGAPSAHLE